jgi:hypothetical protein
MRRPGASDVETGRPGGGGAAHVAWRLTALLPAVCGLALSAGCASTPTRPEVTYESEPWEFAGIDGRRLHTEHYDIYTTIQDPVLVEALPDFVESAYAHYTRIVPPARPPERRMAVFLFATRAQWEAFTRKFTRARAAEFLKVRNGGYSERGVSVIQYVSHRVTFPLFAHEGLHQYLYHCVEQPIPAWLNEGLAVYCEGQRWNDTRLDHFDPAFNPDRQSHLVEALVSERLLSLRDLLETNAGEVMDGTTRQVVTYYAQVWGLMMFLLEGADGRYAEDFGRLLRSVSAGDLRQHARAAFISSEERDFNYGTAVFRSFISDDIEAVEREYRAFLRQRFIGPG